MKKTTIFVIWIILLAILGCTIPEATTEGSLKLTINNGINSKTLVPTLDIKPAYYQIKGRGPEGAQFDENTTSNEVTIGFLRFGDWDISIFAYNAEGSFIASGRARFTVHVGETTSVPVTIRLLQGTGSFNLGVSWYQNEVENPSITGVLKSSSGNDINLEFFGSEGDIGTENVFADTGNTVPVGYYTLIVKVHDLGASGTANHLALGAVEVARILKDQTTYGDYFLQGVPGMGKIDVNITQDFDDPIEVSLESIPFMEVLPTTADYDSGLYLDLKAVVPAADEDAGNITFVWYLNGETVGVDDNYSIQLDNSPLSTNINGKYAPGHYRLDVTAFNIDGSRAGSASFEFDVTGDTGQILPTPTPGVFVVNIPDATLESAIRTQTGILEGDLYNTDLAVITGLNSINTGSDPKISDLSGIEYCTGLTNLNLSNNNITDISRLSGLSQITSLSLDSNPIGDFTPISGLTTLTSIGLANTQFSDVSVLKNLTNLKGLTLNNNPGLIDITDLQYFTDLKHLNLNYCNVSDLSPISGLTKIEYLFLRQNDITDLSPISGLTLISELNISSNTIKNLSSVADLVNLKYLYAAGMGLSDISPLANHPSLVYIYLISNSIVDITSLTDIANLSTVNIENNKMVIGPGDPQGKLNLDTITGLQYRGVTVKYENGNQLLLPQ